MKILTEATAIALWHEVLKEAQSDCHITLKTEVEAYLVFMLMRYTTYQALAKEILATQLLKGMQASAPGRDAVLQNVGDQCLLISGLFPAVAEKRLVKLRYYIEMGQIAYEVISHKNNDIFSALSQQFVPLMDVLQSFRPYTPAPLPLEMSQIWENVESLQDWRNKHKKL